MTTSRDLEEYESWEKSRNSFWENFKKSISPIALFGFVGLVFFGWYMVSKSDINPTWVFIITGAILALIIFRTDKAKQKEPIKENVIKIIAKALLERKIEEDGELPIGTVVQSLPYCKMRYEGEWGQPFRPWKWEVGFRVTYAKGNKETWIVILHPFDGYITGIVRKSSGYSGEESNDLKVLMPLQLAVKEEKAKA